MHPGRVRCGRVSLVRRLPARIAPGRLPDDESDSRCRCGSALCLSAFLVCVAVVCGVVFFGFVVLV